MKVELNKTGSVYVGGFTTDGNDLVVHLPDDYQGDVRQDDADLVAVN